MQQNAAMQQYAAKKPALTNTQNSVGTRPSVDGKPVQTQ